VRMMDISLVLFRCREFQLRVLLMATRQMRIGTALYPP